MLNSDYMIDESGPLTENDFKKLPNLYTFRTTCNF